MIYAFSKEQIFSEGYDRTKYELGYLRKYSNSLKTEVGGISFQPLGENQ